MPASHRKLSAVLCADIVGYSRLMGADEEGTLARVHDLRRNVVEPAARRNGGRIVKTTGDGFLLEFDSSVASVRCGFDIQMENSRRDAGSAHPMQLRIGINSGDVIHEGGDIFGDGVNVAARLEALAPPGRVCVSQVVFDQVRGRLDME